MSGRPKRKRNQKACGKKSNDDIINVDVDAETNDYDDDMHHDSKSKKRPRQSNDNDGDSDEEAFSICPSWSEDQRIEDYCTISSAGEWYYE